MKVLITVTRDSFQKSMSTVLGIVVVIKARPHEQDNVVIISFCHMHHLQTRRLVDAFISFCFLRSV